MNYILNEIRIYVGTYKKYNEGNLFGKWFTLSNYDDIEAFYADCKRLHQDEKDPELMFQDWQCPEIFDGFISECHLDKSIFEMALLLEEMSDDDIEIVQNYIYLTGIPLNEQTIEKAQERYIGYFSTETDFAEYYAEQTGLL
ncbi:antirestriction protein ArdA [Capnocytophaga stomatis]|uniref:antirestriction protein ArdA n=1 Tax=Capnocytophaga stomatis TaxID=1848904 RepID=UPI00385C2614